MSWSYWIIASIVLFVVEIITPGTFFFACLGLGALVAGLIFLLAPVSWLSWIIFSVVSLVSIYTIRPIAKKFLQVHSYKTNIDALIGHKAWVTEDIIPPNLGMVKVEGEMWRAEASERVDAGNYVEVLAIRGTRLEVKKI
jgi:membrane protein implicated in regulation of membrane protease activity